MRAAPIAVASAPPRRFAGGGYREAMKGEMTGWFELRVDGPGRHHYRLFCLLDYEAQGVDKPLLVVTDGRDKPFRTTLSNADYAAVRRQKAPDRRRLLLDRSSQFSLRQPGSPTGVIDGVHHVPRTSGLGLPDPQMAGPPSGSQPDERPGWTFAFRVGGSSAARRHGLADERLPGAVDRAGRARRRTSVSARARVGGLSLR